MLLDFVFLKKHLICCIYKNIKKSWYSNYIYNNQISPTNHIFLFLFYNCKCHKIVLAILPFLLSLFMWCRSSYIFFKCLYSFSFPLKFKKKKEKKGFVPLTRVGPEACKWIWMARTMCYAGDESSWMRSSKLTSNLLWLSVTLSLFLCVCRHLESPASLEKSSDIFFAVNEATLFHVCLFF